MTRDVAAGLAGRADLPLPVWLFVVVAAVVLVISFAALAFDRRAARSERARRVVALPAWADPLAGAIGVALFAVVVVSGLAGTASAQANLAPTAVYVGVWLGLLPVSLVAGDVFRALNPWRAVARAARAMARRAGVKPSQPRPYPPWLGRWPAAAGVAAFAAMQLVAGSVSDPRALALALLLYAGAQLIGMSLFGIERWCRDGDGIGVWFSLVAAAGPAHWRQRTLHYRPPLSQLVAQAAKPGTVALLCVLIGAASFDALTATGLWVDVQPRLVDAWLAISYTETSLETLPAATALLASILAVAALYTAGARLMVGLARSGPSGVDAGRLFACSLVPIAIAYWLAHGMSLLAYQGQALWWLASDPLGRGWNVFGTATAVANYGVIGPETMWYLQVLIVVGGHVAGLAVAHQLALQHFSSRGAAARTQIPMLCVMVALTTFGLLLLASLNA